MPNKLTRIITFIKWFNSKTKLQHFINANVKIISMALVIVENQELLGIVLLVELKLVVKITSLHKRIHKH